MEFGDRVFDRMDEWTKATQDKPGEMGRILAVLLTIIVICYAIVVVSRIVVSLAVPTLVTDREDHQDKSPLPSAIAGRSVSVHKFHHMISISDSAVRLKCHLQKCAYFKRDTRRRSSLATIQSSSHSTIQPFTIQPSSHSDKP